MPSSSPEAFGGRVAIVGCGHRARLYTRAVSRRPASTIVGLCDPNPVRLAYHQEMLKEAGEPAAKEYDIADFEKMLDEQEVEALVVTTVDSQHDVYIVPALRRGIRVLTEKPMTTDSTKLDLIMKAVEETQGSVQVLFNYRYNPVHEKIFDVISSGAIGDVTSVHFEWLLDTVHGADYFRRWHRNKENSGGLMVHKSGHHFDLVNWWLGNVKPVSVFGFGQTAFYGADSGGARAGWKKEYERAATGGEEAASDPFAIHIDDQPDLKDLYGKQAVEADSYHRDMNVFSPDVAIEDDMSVLVKFNTGATMTYHLTAYSPWEGYRVMFNGTKGRLELEVVETLYRLPIVKGGSAAGVVHGEGALPNEGSSKITLHELWKEPKAVPFVVGTGGHGGGDDRMLSQIFGPLPGEKPEVSEVSKRGANEQDGAWALAIGLAANESFKTGKLVNIEELLGLRP